MWQKLLSSDIENFVFTNEISQINNDNANAQLWIQPDNTVLKHYVIFNDLTRENIYLALRSSKTPCLRRIKQLVLPLSFVYDDNIIVGYTMPYCKGTTLDEALHSDKFSSSVLLKAFENLATVINRLPKNFRIGDLHGRNVLIEENGEIHLIDIDGFSFCPSHMLTCPMAGLENTVIISNLKKYWSDDLSLKISKDTDIYCFFQLLFRWLMQIPHFEIYTLKEIFNYLDYISALGFPADICDMFRRLFTDKKNIIVPKSLRKIDISKLDEYSYKSYVKSLL